MELKLKSLVKLFLAFLFIFSLSNKVFSKDMGKTYKICKAYQSNGFQLKNISDAECFIFFKGIIAVSKNLCITAQIYHNMWKKGDGKDNLTKSIILEQHSSSANLKDINSVITSFLNDAEKIPEVWDNPPTLMIQRWLNQKWQCKIKK